MDTVTNIYVMTHWNFKNSFCHNTANMVADGPITLNLTLINDVHLLPSPPTAGCDVIGVKFLRLCVQVVHSL